MATQKQPNSKRFISGVTCPACGRLDSIVLYTDKDLKRAECIECGHKMIEETGEQP